MILNWDTELVLWAERLRGASFEWGRVDCLSAALTALSFVVGEDTVEIDDWNDRESFIQAVNGAGGSRALLEKHCRKVGLKRLQTGDLVWTPSGCNFTDLGSITVVVRNVQLMVSPRHGAKLLPLKFAIDATGWRWRHAW